MMSQTVLQIHRFVLLILHITLVKSTFSYEAQTSLERQAFIQSGKEVKYMIDGVPIHDEVKINIPAHLSYSHGRVSASPVRFDPPYLDFKENPIGQPHLEQVTLFNPDAEKVVHLLSISASTPHFHCSFFHDKVVPKGGNTTFDVVFLAREVGNVENTLYIQTSRGTYKYQVFGVGQSSPYRLHSFIGAKIPVNSSFSPFIHFYNPHSYPIQITEMYTSGSDLHLELPNGLLQATRKFWEVPPFETRTIMRLRLVGRREANNTAFVRIKTNATDDTGGLVIPVEVEVSNKEGIYYPSEKLNFGILRTLDNPKPTKFILINNSNRTLHITNVELEKPNEAIHIDFRPVKILPNVVKPSLVAMVTFTALKVNHPRQCSGNIVARTLNDEYVIKVPYTAEILHGSLEYEANITKFFSGDSNQKIIRSLHLTNKFNFTVAIYSVSLQGEAVKIFNIKDFQQPSVINPRETKKVFSLEFNPKRWNNGTETAAPPQFITQIGIFSNASLFVIPLFVYHGKLTIIPHRPEQFKGHLQFGTLGVNEVRSLNFTLRNENPVDVYIQEISTDWEHITVELRGIERGKGTTLSRNNCLSLSPSPINLKPFHFAMYTVTVKAPSIEMVFVSKIKVSTQYETFEIPYYLITAGGSLTVQPDPFILENSFPGKLTRGPLIVKSSFQDYVELKSVGYNPNDTRFSFEASPSRQLPRLLSPKANTAVGHVVFDPSNFCQDLYYYLNNHHTVIGADDQSKPHSSSTKQNCSKAGGICRENLPYCHVGFDLATPMGVKWLEGTALKNSVVDLDLQIYNSLLYHWDLLQQNDNHVVNTTLLMDTNQVRGFLSKVQTSLVLPSIIGRRSIKEQATNNPTDLPTSSRFYSVKLDFGLRQLRNISVMHIDLENPSDRTVVIQAMPLAVYPNPSLILEKLGLQEAEFELEDKQIFSVVDPGGNNQLRSQFNVNPHNESTSLLLPPKASYSVKLYFQPVVIGHISTLLMLRNNLTGLERIHVSGIGGEGELAFDMEMLQFELTEKHLKNCDKSVQVKGSPPNFTVRRPFVIRNSGQLPVYIQGFSFGPSQAPALIRTIFIDQSTNRLTTSQPAPAPDSDTVDKSGVLQAPSNQHLWCSGYGFEVPDCQGFQLEVNKSRKIEVIFTPDFSLHRIHQQLRVYTSLSSQPLNVTVVATLPQHMLYRCSQALERPDMEFLLWYILLIVVSFVAVCIVGMAYCEADRIFTRHVLHRQLIMSSPGNQVNPSRVFDLRPGSLFSRTVAVSSTDDSAVVFDSSDVLTNQNGCKQSNESSPATVIGDVSSQHMKQQQVTMLQTANRKKRRGFIHDIYQWLTSDQRSSLKPKLEPINTDNNNSVAKTNQTSGTTISATTASKPGVVNTLTTSASNKSNKTQESTDSGKKGAPSGNLTSQQSNRSRRQTANNNKNNSSVKHNSTNNSSSANNAKTTSKPAPGTLAETSEPPDFAPIPIPRHNKNGKRGGSIQPLNQPFSVTSSSVVSSNRKVGGKKLPPDDSIPSCKHSQSAEDSVSVSTDSSNEDKNVTNADQSVRYRGVLSDESKLEETAPVKSHKVDCKSSNRSVNKRHTVQPDDDGNDAEDEEEETATRKQQAPLENSEGQGNKPNQTKYKCTTHKRNKHNMSNIREQQQQPATDSSITNTPNRPFNKTTGHKAPPMTSIVKPVQLQKQTVDAPFNQSHSSSESELPLWEDVPVESLKPENIEQLSSRTEQFARFSDFLAPPGGQYGIPAAPYPQSLDLGMYHDASLRVVGAPKVMVANMENVAWQHSHLQYIQQQQAQGVMPGPNTKWVQPMPEHMTFIPPGGQIPTIPAQYYPQVPLMAPVHYQQIPPGHPVFDRYDQKVYYVEEPLPAAASEWSMMGPSHPDVRFTSSPSDESNFSLPRITEDRRQSMLEYERRCQQNPGGRTLTSNDSGETQYFTASEVEEMTHEAFVRGCAAAKSGCVPLDGLDAASSLWTKSVWANDDTAFMSKGLWSDVEPGSRDDTLANNLLPPDLLNNDSSLNSSFRETQPDFYNGQNTVWSSTLEDLPLTRPQTCSPGSSAQGSEDANEETKGETQISSSPDISSK